MQQQLDGAYLRRISGVASPAVEQGDYRWFGSRGNDVVSASVRYTSAAVKWAWHEALAPTICDATELAPARIMLASGHPLDVKKLTLRRCADDVTQEMRGKLEDGRALDVGAGG